MKKTIALILALMLAACMLSAMSETVTGSWQVAESCEITPERRETFEKAVSGLLGVSYEPVAYLGTQVVAGLNHCFLCRATPVVPGGIAAMKLVYVYEGLNGEASVLDVQDLDIAPSSRS